MIEALPGKLSDIYDANVVNTIPVGTRYECDGKEYIFLAGVDNAVVGSWVTYDEAGVTTLLTGVNVGPVAVACSAAQTGEYGWFQRMGAAEALAAAAMADNTTVYATATAGKVAATTANGAKDRIKRAWCRDAISATGLGTFQLDHPFMDNKPQASESASTSTSISASTSSSASASASASTSSSPSA